MEYLPLQSSPDQISCIEPRYKPDSIKNNYVFQYKKFSSLRRTSFLNYRLKRVKKKHYYTTLVNRFLFNQRNKKLKFITKAIKLVDQEESNTTSQHKNRGSYRKEL